jgi:hypothetical protein
MQSRLTKLQGLKYLNSQKNSLEQMKKKREIRLFK